MSFRKEKKIRLSYADFFKIQNEMINRGFIELHPARIVNSLYFDNENLSFFVDSEEGVLPRKKIRVRWYDDDFNFTKETKISSIEGRFK
jgi:SPX domain protein involved in polyphosphate accumulation